jgi:hypothetical protein
VSSVVLKWITRGGDAGACEALVSVLQKHTKTEAVVERACQAVANLSKGQGNTGWFGATGCCDAIIAVLIAHKESTGVASAAWSAVGNLCTEENNRNKLVGANACELVVER